MTKEVSLGVRRLRQAIANQATCGSGQFELSIDSADRLCRECEDELTRLSWAAGVPAPVDADGEVVPLTTKVMYDDDGEKFRIARFRFDLAPGASSTWLAEYAAINGLFPSRYVKNLHLTRPDSWERLEEDVARVESHGYPCDYFNHADCGMPCYSCPAHTDAEDCTAELARDILRRAKALAKRDWQGQHAHVM